MMCLALESDVLIFLLCFATSACRTEVVWDYFLQFKLYDCDEIRCFLHRKAELGKGGYGTVRCSAHRLLGNIAVKCFSVSGGYADKDTIARMYDICN